MSGVAASSVDISFHGGMRIGDRFRLELIRRDAKVFRELIRELLQAYYAAVGVMQQNQVVFHVSGRFLPRKPPEQRKLLQCRRGDAPSHVPDYSGFSQLDSKDVRRVNTWIDAGDDRRIQRCPEGQRLESGRGECSVSLLQRIDDRHVGAPLVIAAPFIIGRWRRTPRRCRPGHRT